MAPRVSDISVAQFAGIIGVTSQRVYQLIQAGLPHRMRGKTARIVSAEAIKWLRERDRAEAVVEKEFNEVRERARKLRFEADMKELQLAELRRSLVPASESTSYVAAFVGGLASVAAGQLGRFEREMVKVETAAEARALRNKIHRALMEGAQRYADQMAAEADALESEVAAAAAPEATKGASE